MTVAPDAVVDAFLALVAEKGFVEVTLRDVAARADSGLADLYRLYPDKVALVAAFLARVDAALLAEVRELVRDVRVLDRVLLADGESVALPVRVLEREEHDDVDRDQGDRDQRESPRRDVVL